MKDTSTCLDALNAFARKAFAGWRGLPPCALDDVLRVFPAQDDFVGIGRLGQKSVTVNYRFCEVPAYPLPVRVSFVGAELRLIEAEGPLEDLDFQALASQLDAAAAKLDTWFGFARIPEGEWVYPARGIAFSSDVAGRDIHRLWVFAATTLDAYRRELRVDLRQRRLPEAEWN